MPLRPLYGHDTVRDRLATAIRTARLPQALLLDGPRGVGKQRLALWLAQALLCEQAPSGGGCGTCRSCRLVSTLSHPDLHWFVPLELSRKGADADKQIELVEAALGRRKVFIIGNAERLVPQRSNPEAANALLKVLEEPPSDTLFVLAAAEPDGLLPTILSRVVRVRLQRLPDSVVTSFVQAELSDLGNPDRAVSEAEGCIGRVLANSRATVAGERDPAAAFAATLQASAADRYAAALRQAPFQARGGFTDMLDGLLERLRREARAGGETRRIADAIALVMEAREQAQGNVNPQLLAAVLAEDLAER